MKLNHVIALFGSMQWAQLLQLPFEEVQPPFWLEAMQNIVNVFLALTIRGYLIFVLLGFMIFVTGVFDGLAKTLVGIGVFIFFFGPYITNMFAAIAGVEIPSPSSARNSWISLVGLSDSTLIHVLITLGNLTVAIGLLAGSILYFVPSSNELKSKGHSLIVRALMLTPVLFFFSVTPWI
ncbi:MAG: hypothetical protein JSW61_06680 [Candidatus Thorarchaeota archaeon]|nr:MAG: hypothetical protein JSW61_06680 [Candidatus Thorarchaeota archaeon]